MDNYIPIIVAIAFMVIGFVSESVKAKKLKNPNTPAGTTPKPQQTQPHPAPVRKSNVTILTPAANPIKVPKSNPIKVPKSNPILVPDSSPVKFLDGEKIEPITFKNNNPVDLTIPEMKMAQEADPYAIDNHDFSHEYDWKKAIIASEILKTKF